VTDAEAVVCLPRRNKPEELWRHMGDVYRLRRTTTLRHLWRKMVRQHQLALYAANMLATLDGGHGDPAPRPAGSSALG